MNNLLEIKDAHVYIGSFYILQGISLTVPKGEVTLLLGRNGSGKTTTMKSILGLYPPRSGQIIFNGEDISKLKNMGVDEVFMDSDVRSIVDYIEKNVGQLQPT